ncbi:FtsK/SpoIIIE domain-containing protein [Micromonospora sp. DH14]|uniref:FtsK/SpoIIIE domain-containing protein n=1 Tax=Micromonospora sp. DH14 TaxID=3040120 RepID=UPI0024420F44|nr:FtsK/SpoIIIE domain-containing protein [Micromonospora sp. DH14]MDG9673036.1 FtsK/SpoIIIE domain-containing protein [Micromonospora sp. DH14]
MAELIHTGDDLEPIVPAPRASEPEFFEPRGEQLAIEGGREDGPPVDPPRTSTTFADITSRYQGDRKPIVPASLRSKAGRHALMVEAVSFVTYSAAIHITRSPKYAVKVAWYAPWGVARITGKAIRWTLDLEGEPFRQHAANRLNTQDYLDLSRQRDRRVGGRVWKLAPIVLLLVVVAGLLVFVAPWWAQALAAAIVVPFLAHVGRPIDAPILDRVFNAERFIRLTAGLTRAAILACSVKGIKDAKDIKFVRDISREGPGHEALVLLPAGVLATDVIDERDRLASGFRLPKTQVWPSTVDGQHPGMLSIWVADKPVSSMKAPAWPLLESGTFDYFTGTFVYGHDERMRPVTYSLAEKNSLFAGIPGSGKTLAARVVLLAGVLDPLVVPVVFDFKGSGDVDCFEPLCPEGLYGSGADEVTKANGLNALEWLLSECDERAPLVRKYAAQGMNTVNKVNRKMAEHDARLRPLVAFFDELQELLTDPIHGKRAKFLLTSIVKRGRALGIHIVFATQRIDKESVPRGISSNIALRTCLAVTSHTETDLVLGTGSYARGARPTEFEPGDSTGPKDSGWGYRAGAGPTRPCRSSYVDNPAAEKVVVRALEMRRGEQPVEVPRIALRNLLADVRQVWHEGEEALWSELIVPRLQALDPEAYADLTVEVFGAWMARAGVKTESIGRRIEGKATTRKGVKLAALDARITEKNAETIASTDLAEVES